MERKDDGLSEIYLEGISLQPFTTIDDVFKRLRTRCQDFGRHWLCSNNSPIAFLLSFRMA